MTLAVVKWFNDSKGYGFLTALDSPQHGKSDIFVHYTEIKGTLNAPGSADSFKTLAIGQLVECDILSTPRGDYKAANVWKTSEFLKPDEDESDTGNYDPDHSDLGSPYSM